MSRPAGDAALDAALAFDGTFTWSAALGVVESEYDRGGVDAALATAREHVQELRAGRWMIESEVNQLGYRLLRNGSTDEALAVFLLNTELFPQAWNAWDSLAEALTAAGRAGEVAQAMRRSLELNVYNDNARRALRLLSIEATGSKPR